MKRLTLSVAVFVAVAGCFPAKRVSVSPDGSHLIVVGTEDADGLFRDPAIYGEGWYKGDPEWCGRRHLSGYVVMALACLGATGESRS